ncbi:MAG: type II toxin-antitoxin system VapC family toxin [Deltaproteobacteria bacterium]|nr:type II toxin-antitoxin system VapC family toxin [Deltaproteobacteria bacterium]
MVGGLVLDCSVSAAWCLKDEANAAADSVLAALAPDGALVPALWAVEMANILVMAERRGRISPGDADRAVELLGQLPLRLDPAGADTMRRARTVARENGLTAYDASYLELAMRAGVPLATFDGDLAEAAGRQGVRVVGRP